MRGLLDTVMIYRYGVGLSGVAKLVMYSEKAIDLCIIVMRPPPVHVYWMYGFLRHVWPSKGVVMYLYDGNCTSMSLVDLSLGN